MNVGKVLAYSVIAIGGAAMTFGFILALYDGIRMRKKYQESMK